MYTSLRSLLFLFSFYNYFIFITSQCYGFASSSYFASQESYRVVSSVTHRLIDQRNNLRLNWSTNKTSLTQLIDQLNYHRLNWSTNKTSLTQLIDQRNYHRLNWSTNKISLTQLIEQRNYLRLNWSTNEMTFNCRMIITALSYETIDKGSKERK
jgi:hypothetical protein